MKFSLLPRLMLHDLTELTPALLKEKGIRLLMLDFDNTIVPYTTSIPTPAMEAWLNRMVTSDIQLCVVSNSRKDRVKIFCQKWGIDCITRSQKPFSKGIRQCLKKYAICPCQCALVGDQIYTDVLGANGCGVYSILVKAIHNHTFWLKLRHALELPFIGIAKLLRR